MRKPCATTVAAVLSVLGAIRAPAQKPVPGAAVELPPMMVEESVSSVPWLYVQVDDVEVLSRCSASVTRAFVEGWLAKMALVRAVVPAEFLAKTDVPALFVLYAQDLKQTVSAEIQRELQGQAGRKGSRGRDERINIAPNMRLSDRDLQASIVYLDEQQFDAAGMSVAPGHVRFLLRGRVPELPSWLVDGIERAWRGADFVLEPITFAPLTWIDRAESEALADDPAYPRALLPTGELLAAEGTRLGERQVVRRALVRSAQQELLFRWALASGPAMRNGYWKLAARAAEGPVTEEMLEECLGWDFAELRDRLSDFLPRAVRETVPVSPGPPALLPDFSVDRATPNQIARVRGEWERLAIGHVQQRLPAVREPYVAQARRTLRRAYDAGDRDPRLLAALGLCELEAGDEAKARTFLEPAVTLGVRRPRAHYELARLRFEELRRGAPESRVFSYTDLAPVIEPLRRAVTQAPPLPEVFILLADAWAQCDLAPTDAEIAELERGARLFPARPSVRLPVALALARHGRRSEAEALVEVPPTVAADDETRGEIERLRAAVTSALSRGTTDGSNAIHRERR